MKPSYLLINLLLIGGGILIYDQVRGDATAPAPAAWEHLRADPFSPPGDPRGNADPMTASGGLRDRSAEARWEEFEGRLLALEGVVSRMRARGNEDAGSRDATATDGSPLPPLAEADQVDERDPSFDERSLKSLEIMMDEINRRKAEQRQRDRVGGELDRLGIQITEGQRDAVIDETLKYQEKARDLLRRGWPRDEAGRESRRKAFESLQGEWTTTINRLVPTAEAEKIAASRIARGMGFYAGQEVSRFNRRDRRGSGDR